MVFYHVGLSSRMAFNVTTLTLLWNNLPPKIHSKGGCGYIDNRLMVFLEDFSSNFFVRRNNDGAGVRKF